MSLGRCRGEAAYGASCGWRPRAGWGPRNEGDMVQKGPCALRGRGDTAEGGLVTGRGRGRGRLHGAGKGGRITSVRSMEATATERRAATYSESGRICVDGGRRRGRPQVRAGGGRRWEGVGGEATYREMCLCAA